MDDCHGSTVAVIVLAIYGFIATVILVIALYVLFKTRKVSTIIFFTILIIISLIY